jgi:hypothetical protein
LEKNPGDAVTKKFLDIMSMVKEPCNPLPTPEEAFKEDQRPKYTFKKPDNIVSPDDGAEIVWLISRGIGNDTIHLGISLSDKSFWRYVYGSNSGIKPASPEEEKQLLHFMKLWEIYGIEAEDLSVSNVAGCCHFKTARGGVARAFLYPNLLNPCSRNGPVGVTGHWMPTISQINKLEEALPTYLTTIGQNKLAATINQYDFLYLGIMVGQNTIIYIDALRKDPIKMVRRELAQDWQPKNKVGWIAGSCDGGDAAWGVEYDPKTSKFKHFAVNGG